MDDEMLSGVAEGGTVADLRDRFLGAIKDIFTWVEDAYG